MIGIYKITNSTNGRFYIGKSVDIERRFMEHKTPKATGNKKLHSDINALSIENFDFEILEECKEEELNARELHYIKTLNPFYNTVGKKVSDEVRKRISEGTKKWWNSLDDAKKQKVIKNNLTGPRKGHSVSEETREKIRKKVSENQKIKVKIAETGEEFDSIGSLEKYLGACTGTVSAYWKGKIKSVKGYHVAKV